MQNTRKRWTLPLALGVLTALALVAVLWPKAAPQQTVVVAARDLGAGTTLTTADLSTSVLPAAQAPADALADPAQLAGQTLAVVRFTGEPITARHLGQAVTLTPTERGIAVRVQAETGLAGLLRPGMQVGVIATLAADSGREVYAKTVLEGLRVLFVSADFQARPYAPTTASATVNGGNDSQATSTAGSTGTVREGVLVLAASTQAQPVRYELIQPTAPLTATLSAAPTDTLKAAKVAPPPEPPVRWIVPVELLAALNARGQSLTLTLLPTDAQSYTTVGTQITDLYLTPEAQP